MKIRIIFIATLILTTGFIMGWFIQSRYTKKAEQNTLELKQFDESVFDTYRDGINLAADTIGCFGNELCLQDKSSQIDGLGNKLKEQLTERRERYGEEK